MTCPDPQAPQPCPGYVTVPPDCNDAKIRVCSNIYDNVAAAWKATKIPPHKLRHWASSNAHLQVSWV